jgi:ABC transporter substrate binding protein
MCLSPAQSVLSGAHMQRREFVTLLGGAVASWPLFAQAQQSLGKIPVVGVLWHAGSAEEEEVYLSVLVKAFNDLGYVEGKNIHLDHRFPAENPDRFRILAQELVDEKPDVIIAVTGFGAVELKRTTSTIPIVVTLANDAVGMGLPLDHGRRSERKTLGVIEGSGSEPVACRASGRLFHPEQAAHDPVASNCGPSAGNFVVAS